MAASLQPLPSHRTCVAQDEHNPSAVLHSKGCKCSTVRCNHLRPPAPAPAAPTPAPHTSWIPPTPSSSSPSSASPSRHDQNRAGRHARRRNHRLQQHRRPCSPTGPPNRRQRRTLPLLQLRTRLCPIPPHHLPLAVPAPRPPPLLTLPPIMDPVPWLLPRMRRPYRLPNPWPRAQPSPSCPRQWPPLVPAPPRRLGRWRQRRPLPSAVI